MAPSDVTSGAEAEQRFRLMAAAVEQVDDSVEIAQAPSLRLIYVNPAFTRLTGYTAEEALGRTPAELLRSSQHDPGFWAAMEASLREHHSWRGRITSRRKDGRLIHQRCTISPLTDEAGRITHYVAVRHDLSDEERAAAALRASEARLKALMEHAPIVVHLKDRDGRYLLANPESAKVFGRDPATVIGRTPSELFPPREALVIERHHREVLETGQVVVHEEHQPSLDAYAWSVVIRFPVRDEEGRIAVVGGIALDITERKRAEAALRASEARFRAIIEDQTEFISRFTPDFEITFVNNAYAAQQRRSREELIGSSLLDLMNEEQQRQFKAQLAALTPEAPTISYEMDTILADGSRGWEQWTDRALFDAEGRLVEYQSVGRDITEARRTREELRQSEARFRAIVEDQTEVIVRFDKDLRLVFSNRANARLSGKEMEELVGTSFFDPIPEPLRSELRDALAALTPENPVHRGENPKTLPDGTERWFEWTNRALFDDAGQAIGYQTVGRDITERRAAEAEIARQREALHQREKLTALGSLLAGVAHELNNPLSVVVGRALLLEEDVNDPRHAASLAKLRVAAERCGRIVKTFLAMARAKPQQRRPVSANRLIDAALDLAGYGLRSAGVEVERDFEPDLPPVSADEDQLHQVFLNLLLNAQQALRDAPQPRRILLATSCEGGRVRIEVADTGPGIPPDLRSRVFEPFFTTKPTGAGTGIGLSFCHAVIGAHDGTIEAGERPGGGALFTVRLPAVDVIVPAPELLPGAFASPGQARILVVDDEPDILALLDEILSRDGYTIERAASGREALEQVACGRFDLVISDVRMPDGDGRELYRSLCDRHPELARRVLILTGDTLGLGAGDLPGLPREALLEKPVEPVALRSAVRRLLAAP